MVTKPAKEIPRSPTCYVTSLSQVEYCENMVKDFEEALGKQVKLCWTVGQTAPPPKLEDVPKSKQSKIARPFPRRR